jgi:hypothetical protein
VSRILVAMSGGSTVRRGGRCCTQDEVVGVWMRLHDVADSYSVKLLLTDAADDARRVAALNIVLHMLSASSMPA